MPSQSRTYQLGGDAVTVTRRILPARSVTRVRVRVVRLADQHVRLDQHADYPDHGKAGAAFDRHCAQVQSRVEQRVRTALRHTR